jgi:hypothetical protein
MAHTHHNYIPMELFVAAEGSSSTVDSVTRQLVQWGLLQPLTKDIFRMTLPHQITLHKFMTDHRNRPSFDDVEDDEWQNPAFLMVASLYCEAAGTVLMGWKVFRACRLVNHAMTLFWKAHGYLPDEHLKKCRSWLVTALNVVIVGLMCVLAVVVGLGGLLGWLAVQMVGRVVRAPGKSLGQWMLTALLYGWLRYYAGLTWWTLINSVLLHGGLRITSKKLSHKYTQLSPELMQWMALGLTLWYIDQFHTVAWRIANYV